MPSSGSLHSQTTSRTFVLPGIIVSATCHGWSSKPLVPSNADSMQSVAGKKQKDADDEEDDVAQKEA